MAAESSLSKPLDILQKKYGIEIAPEGIALVEERLGPELGSGEALTRACLTTLLNEDVRNYSKGTLPADIARQHDGELGGVHWVQVKAVKNIAEPDIRQDACSGCRLLLATLTDGHTTVRALEMTSLPQLGLDTPPGTKMILRGPVPVERGILLLGKGHIDVLGGRDELLHATWAAARAKRPQRKGEGGVGPPPFTPLPVKEKTTAQTGPGRTSVSGRRDEEVEKGGNKRMSEERGRSGGKATEGKRGKSAGKGRSVDRGRSADGGRDGGRGRGGDRGERGSGRGGGQRGRGGGERGRGGEEKARGENLKSNMKGRGGDRGKSVEKEKEGESTLSGRVAARGRSDGKEQSENDQGRVMSSNQDAPHTPAQTQGRRGDHKMEQRGPKQTEKETGKGRGKGRDGKVAPKSSASASVVAESGDGQQARQEPGDSVGGRGRGIKKKRDGIGRGSELSKSPIRGEGEVEVRVQNIGQHSSKNSTATDAKHPGVNETRRASPSTKRGSARDRSGAATQGRVQGSKGGGRSGQERKQLSEGSQVGARQTNRPSRSEKHHIRQQEVERYEVGDRSEGSTKDGKKKAATQGKGKGEVGGDGTNDEKGIGKSASVDEATGGKERGSGKEWKEGDMCIGQWHDGNWYRVVVKRCQGARYFVKFIDYGNSATLHVTQLRPVPH